jgi:hypothetical protein
MTDASTLIFPSTVGPYWGERSVAGTLQSHPCSMALNSKRRSSSNSIQGIQSLQPIIKATMTPPVECNQWLQSYIREEALSLHWRPDPFRSPENRWPSATWRSYRRSPTKTRPMRIVVASKPVDFRKGSDTLAALMAQALLLDPGADIHRS